MKIIIFITELIHFIAGFIVGALVVICIFFNLMDNKQNIQQENISFAPKELPKDIEFEEIKIPKNLREVIL